MAGAPLSSRYRAGCADTKSGRKGEHARERPSASPLKSGKKGNSRDGLTPSPAGPQEVRLKSGGRFSTKARTASRCAIVPAAATMLAAS